MKKAAIVMSLLLSLSLSAVQAADTKDAPQKNDAQKDQNEQSMEERLRKLGKSLDELQARAKIMAEQARKEAERSLGDAEKKSREAERKLEEMRKESRKQWTKFADEMNAVMEEFERAYERARERFKEQDEDRSTI